MAALSSLPQVVDLALYSGDTYTVAVHAETAFIAGRVFTAQVRTSKNSPTVAATFTITEPTVTDGPAYLQLSAEQTADLYALAPGPFQGVWDVQLAPAAGGDPTITVAQGRFTVEGDVTRVD